VEAWYRSSHSPAEYFKFLNVCLSGRATMCTPGVVTLRLFKWISLPIGFAMQSKKELREVLTDADAVIVDRDAIDEALEYVDEDTKMFTGARNQLGYDLLEDGRVATQVGMSALDQYDNVVVLWVEPGHGLVCKETAPDSSDRVNRGEEQQKEAPDDRTIDPIEKDLDPETLRAVQTLIDELPDTATKGSPEAQEADSDTQSILMETLSSWLDEIERDRRTGS